MLKKTILAIVTIIILIYGIASVNIGNQNLMFIKDKITFQSKQKIKKYIFPYKYIDNLEAYWSGEIRQKFYYMGFIYYHDLAIKNSLQDLELSFSKKLNFNDLNLEVYSFTKNKIARGINLPEPGSGYLDFYDNKLFFASSVGIVSYSELKDKKIVFKQINNNIENFVGEKQLRKNLWFSVKDFKIIQNKVFVTYTNEVQEDCWNTSVIYADLNYEYLDFKKFFVPTDCNSSTNPKDGEFNAHQSGGRVFKFVDNNLIFSHGDYRYRGLAQSAKSQFGKILKINIFDKKFETIALGFRNPQGLFYDNEKNIILETEHGPFGGDEINLIDLNKKKLQNFGWPIASYGNHYKQTLEKNKIKYPLLKSHRDNGFEEPLRWFTPALGISEILKIDNNKYILASMRSKSFYIFELDVNNKISNFKQYIIGERIRDLARNEKDVFLFLENTASIGILKNVVNLN